MLNLSLQHLDPANRYLKYKMTPEEYETARLVSPYFMMLLQTKIAEYAEQVVDTIYDDAHSNPWPVVIQHEKQKAAVRVLEEFMQELKLSSTDS